MNIVTKVKDKVTPISSQLLDLAGRKDHITRVKLTRGELARLRAEGYESKVDAIERTGESIWFGGLRNLKLVAKV